MRRTIIDTVLIGMMLTGLITTIATYGPPSCPIQQDKYRPAITDSDFECSELYVRIDTDNPFRD